MAEEIKRKAVVDKWKKKKNYFLVAPKMFGSGQFGETVAAKPELVMGRCVVVNMGSLTNQMRNKGTDLMLRVEKVEGSNAYTELVGFEGKKGYLRRMFRRKSSKIEPIQFLTTKDGKKIKIKTVVVTVGKRDVSKRKAIRKELEEFVKKTVAENNCDKLVELLLDKSLFDPLFKVIRKIVPVQKAEVEFVKVVA